MTTEHMFASFYEGKTVLVTGHTGFKGGWLCTWLKMLGARVVGFSLPPEAGPHSLFQTARVGEGMVSIFGDVRDYASLLEVCETYQPEVIFHLAAQPLVRQSYAAPVDTCTTNIIGATHVLEATRHSPSVRAVVVVTTDKCYDNREWVYAYRENDPLGGYDLYSASKAAAEIVTASYRNSFFNPDRVPEHGKGIASVRAGNVIGGGDWSVDRLIPDCIRALAAGGRVPIRNPHAVRPWQHVLEPLSGYLWLGTRLGEDPRHFAGAWNFGPAAAGHVPVREIVEQIVQEWGSSAWEDLSRDQTHAPHEAACLKLDCTKAAELLGWFPVLSVRESVADTSAWYRRMLFDQGFDGRAATMEQINAYVQKAHHAGIRWATPRAIAAVA